MSYKVFKNTLKFIQDNILVVECKGYSDKILKTLNGKHFDIIYIDGCHLYPEVLEDIRGCDALLVEGGYMCGDDLEMQLSEVDHDAAYALAKDRQDWARDPRNNQYFHPGVTHRRGRILWPRQRIPRVLGDAKEQWRLRNGCAERRHRFIATALA